jgi:hypothetical protein
MSTIPIIDALKKYYGNEFSDNDYHMFLKMKNHGALQIFPRLMGKNNNIFDLDGGLECVNLIKNTVKTSSFERINRTMKKCKIIDVIFLDDDEDKFAELMDNPSYNFCGSITKEGIWGNGCDMLIKYIAI